MGASSSTKALQEAHAGLSEENTRLRSAIEETCTYVFVLEHDISAAEAEVLSLDPNRHGNIEQLRQSLFLLSFF